MRTLRFEDFLHDATGLSDEQYRGMLFCALLLLSCYV